MKCNESSGIYISCNFCSTGPVIFGLNFGASHFSKYSNQGK